MNSTPNPGPTLQPLLHSSQHMRVVNNLLAEEGARELSSRITQLEMRWDAGLLRLQFSMRETRMHVPLRDAMRQRGRRPGHTGRDP